MSGAAPDQRASEEAAGNAVPAPLAVQAGPLRELPAGYYDLPVVPDWSVGLNDKQRRYVEAYLGDANFSSAAACRAAGYSEGRGARLRRDARVIKAIESCMRDSGIARQRVLAELGALAFTSLSDVVDWKDGKMAVRDASELSDEQRRSVASLKVDSQTGLIVEVGMSLRGNALALLAKALRIVGPEMAIGITGENVQVILSKEDQQVL